MVLFPIRDSSSTSTKVIMATITERWTWRPSSEPSDRTSRRTSCPSRLTASTFTLWCVNCCRSNRHHTTDHWVWLSSCCCTAVSLFLPFITYLSFSRCLWSVIRSAEKAAPPCMQNLKFRFDVFAAINLWRPPRFICWPFCRKPLDYTS